MQATLSPQELADWFGSSQAVDTLGQPLVLYHGTDAQFDRFEASYIGHSQEGKLFAGRGFYFSNDKMDASAYGANVLSVHLRMQKTLDLRNKGEFLRAFADLIPRDQVKTLAQLAHDYREAKTALKIDDVMVKEESHRPGFYDVQWKIAGEWQSSWPRTPSSLELSDDMTGRRYAERHALPPNPEVFLNTSAFSYADITKAVLDNGYDSAINDGSIGVRGDEYVVFAADQIMILPEGFRSQLKLTSAEPQWSNDAIVVDKKNKPLVVYHGTNAEFDAFKTGAHSSIEQSRLGAYFTTDERVAGHYGGKVSAYHLAFNKLFDIAGMDSLTTIDKMPVSDLLKRELRSAFRNADLNQQYGMLESLVGRGLRQSLEAAGYDGVMYTEAYADSYIAFHPGQIKAVPKELYRINEDEQLEGLNRIVNLPGLKNKAGTAYTFYTVATRTIDQADGDMTRVDWQAIEDATISACICSNGQSPQQVHETLSRVSPGAVTAARQEAILVAALASFERIQDGPGSVGMDRELATP